MNEWKSVAKDDLEKLYYIEQMSDQGIADLYGVARSTVIRKRRQFGITYNLKLYKGMEQSNSELMEKLNHDSYERLQTADIDSMAKALTHYAFRNGPVEDMHADGKLMEEDMMVLNKFMVNHLAYILDSVIKGEWLHLEILYSYYRCFGGDWDKAQLDHDEVEILLDSVLSGRDTMYNLWLNEQEHRK